MATPELSSSGIPHRDTQVLVEIYRDAAKQLAAIVASPAGLTQASREFRQARAAQLIAQVDRVTLQAKVKATSWIPGRLSQAFKDGIRRADAQAKEAGVIVPGSVVTGSFSLLDQRSVEVFARDIAADLNKAADSMGDRAGKVLRQTAQLGLNEKQIDTVLAGGLIHGKPTDTIRTLREQLRGVHGETVLVNGREFDVGYYASMVARTKTREATTHARHERLRELDLDLVAIIGRVSNNFCTAFLGNVYSLSGTSKKYPSYASVPPIPMHPNCTKSTRPFIAELAEPQQLEAAGDNADSRKLAALETTAQMQKSYQDLQLRQQVEARYAHTAAKLFGGQAA